MTNHKPKSGHSKKKQYCKIKRSRKRHVATDNKILKRIVSRSGQQMTLLSIVAQSGHDVVRTMKSVSRLRQEDKLDIPVSQLLAVTRVCCKHQDIQDPQRRYMAVMAELGGMKQREEAKAAEDPSFIRVVTAPVRLNLVECPPEISNLARQ